MGPTSKLYAQLGAKDARGHDDHEYDLGFKDKTVAGLS